MSTVTKQRIACKIRNTLECKTKKEERHIVRECLDWPNQTECLLNVVDLMLTETNLRRLCLTQ